MNSSENEHSNFATKWWYVLDPKTEDGYSSKNPIKLLTSSIESSLRDYSDTYVLVTRNINVVEADDNTKLRLKIVHHLENAQQK